MKDKFRVFRTVICFILIIALPLVFAGCKDKTEKQTEKLSDKYISDRHVEQKFKDPDGKIAFKSDYILPKLEIKGVNEQSISSFNRLMDAIESESQSSAMTVIANKLYEKGKPWKETGGYTVPYASPRYISVLIELQRETSSGKINTTYIPVTYSLIDYNQSSLTKFGKVSSDYLQTQLAKMLMTKISDSGAAVPELSVIRSAFDLTSFVLTSDGFVLYFTNSSLSGFSDIADYYSFTFDEVSNLLDMPNIPEQ